MGRIPTPSTPRTRSRPWMAKRTSIAMTANETGLDYFGARYYGSPQGRFTSPDPLLASAKRINPQTWNRYSYGNNNPLRFTDPDGQDSEDESGDVYLRTKIKTTEVTVQERG